MAVFAGLDRPTVAAKKTSAVSVPTARRPVVQRKCACGPSGDACQACRAQPRLSISQPGDALEQQADRVAESVVRTPDEHAMSLPPLLPARDEPTVQRAADPEVAPDEDDEPVPDEGGMPKTDGTAPPRTAPLHVARSGGRALEPSTRQFFESRMGHDFSAVRVHTDDTSSRSARSIRALAYTVGRNIHFDQGRFQPQSKEGRKLLAHELTHVMQQSRGPESVQRQMSLEEPRLGQSLHRPPPLVGRFQLRPPRLNQCSAGDCPQGKQRRVVRGDCATSGPADRNNFIESLSVALGAQNVRAQWSNGRVDHWPCSPRPGVTPIGHDVVGVKCGRQHTNLHRDGMAWFTGFAAQDLRIGFHDSQVVATGVHSHGCVRVCCAQAKTINHNTWSGRTTIDVSH
jgi:hypothetical protein